MAPIVILSFLGFGFQVSSTKTFMEHRSIGGVRGKSAGTEPNAVETFDAPRIIGGNETIPHEFPSMLLLFVNGYQSCGGMLLDKEWVLSAAHCAYRFDAKIFEFYAGKHNLTLNESTEQKVRAREVVQHEKFGGQNNGLINDIALFKVSPPFEYNENVQKVALPTRGGVYSTGFATIVGWGRNGTGTVPDRLQKASVPLMTNEKCQEMYDRADVKYGIFPVQLCAGGVPGTGVCQGDSGGPMFLEEDGRQVLIGITSWGASCAEEFPAVFTRITEFLDWIENKTGLPASGSAERPISALSGTGNSNINNAAARAKISNGLAQSICKCYADYQTDKTISAAGALKMRPKTPEKCAWFILSKCKDCKPFGMKFCKA